MSSVRDEGKDKIIFVTKEDHETPSSAELVEEDPNDPYEERGLILPNGDINWNCPCLGGMASGPCGTEFKDAFSCFHYSKEEVKGSECLEQFRGMQECLQRYPELYPQEDETPSGQTSESTAAEASGAEPSAAEPSAAEPSAAEPSAAEPLGVNSTPASEEDSDTSLPTTKSSDES
ncbi:coiled-coil-helix-coiled-coil-helix domain containing 4b [Odontesthes bonariensis]|uniref:coiled-coil-helix-coiled-coil-helix domain containing 4b n=1 Tax=Odontesthes bonariensis TaxID=219752 RepID=UPI003F589485